MILLDTNVLTELMRSNANQAVIQWVDRHPTGELFIAALTQAEIELAIELLPKGKRKSLLTITANRMFDEFIGHCLPFDHKAASKYAHLVATRTKNGPPIRVEDGQIAAIALANGLALATRNVADYVEIDRLRVINPWHASHD